LMVHMGDADALVSGVTQHYPDTIRPALQVIKTREDVHKVSGLYGMITRKGELLFLADCSVNIEPSAEDLVEIALCAAEAARRFDVEPRVAMLSFSNFGGTKHPQCEKVRRATEMLKRRDPALMVEGELMADIALSPEILERDYPFSSLKGGANVLIFPDLNSANIAYKLLMKVGGAEAIGPILMGMRKPVYVLQRGAEVEDVVHITAIAVVDAQENEAPRPVRDKAGAVVAAD
jgi:malate dehydrogenase (oxaloacetate-decarboxylating)(NADP+)